MLGSNLQRGLLVVLIALLAAIAAVLLTGGRVHSSSASTATDSKFDGPTMPPGLHAANFVLTDQFGHRVSLSEHRGQVVVLTFIHSLCHDACPFMVEQIKGALNDLPGAGRNVPAIGVTVAPSQDTPANRRWFLNMHEMDGRLEFLNGPLPDVRRVWHAYAIQPGTAPEGHSAFVLLIDKRGLERVGFAADQLTPEGLAHDIGVLEREPA
jgi:protein SCO1